MGNEVSVELDGIKELQRDFKRLTKAHPPTKVEKASQKAANVIHKEVKKNAPVGETGKLKESAITKSLNQGKTYASVIVALDREVAWYAGIVAEFGAPHMKPNPFFRNAVRAKGEKAYETLKDELDRLTKKAVR